MAGGVDQTFATVILAAVSINSGTATIGTKTFTGPPYLRLFTVIGSDATTGTEQGTSAGYTAGGQGMTMGVAASASVVNSGAVSWTNMPSMTTVGCEVWDHSATPWRVFWGPWSAGSIVVTSGNTFTVAAAALFEALA
jgi:hypothetical protein